MTRGTLRYPEQLHPNSPKWDTWHALLSGPYSIRTPQEDMWRVPLSGLPQGEAHVTRECHVRTITYPIRIIDWSELVLLHHSDSLPQPTIRCLQSEMTGLVAGHLPRSTACSAKEHEWWQVTSQGLWQPPTGWWWPCHHLGVIMTSQKVLPSLKREDELLTL